MLLTLLVLATSCASGGGTSPPVGTVKPNTKTAGTATPDSYYGTPGSTSSARVPTRTPVAPGPPAPEPVRKVIQEEMSSSLQARIDQVILRGTTPITQANREAVMQRVVDNVSLAIGGDGYFIAINLKSSSLFRMPDIRQFPGWKAYLEKVVAEGNSLLSLDWVQQGGLAAQSLTIANSGQSLLFDTVASFRPVLFTFAPHVPSKTPVPPSGGGVRPAPPAYEVKTHSLMVEKTLDLIPKAGERENYEELFSLLRTSECIGVAPVSRVVDCMSIGAHEEDDGLRWLQHFLGGPQPSLGLRWTPGTNLSPASVISDMPDDVRRTLIALAAEDKLREAMLPPSNVQSNREYLPSARAWARYQGPAGQDVLPDGTRQATWGGAIAAYGSGDLGLAYERLGHIVHLLQDMGQPDHVAGRTHPGSTKTIGELRAKLAKNSCTNIPAEFRDEFAGFEKYWDAPQQQERISRMADATQANDSPLFRDRSLYG